MINLQKEPGKTYSKEEIAKALEEHKPAVLFLTQVPQQPRLYCHVPLGCLCL